MSVKADTLRSRSPSIPSQIQSNEPPRTHSHYHGPLADGLLVGDTVRCPLRAPKFCTAKKIAEAWDSATVDGDLAARDATVTYTRNGRTQAVATVFRDMSSLEAEAKMETFQRTGP